jgi:hypothetical protein
MRLALLQSVILVCAIGALVSSAHAATHQTPNFIVRAVTSEVAERVAVAAEEYRRTIAEEWLGEEIPRWSARCRITVRLEEGATSGDTTYVIHRGEVYGWRMMVQGPLHRIVESVLPHEVSHTILASDFRGALPRWADEGAAVLCEGEQDIVRRQLKVNDLLTVRHIPTPSLLSLSEYPVDADEMLLVYAQGYSLTQFLVEREGKQGFVRFLKDAHEHGWEDALEKAYGFGDVASLDESWRQWLKGTAPSPDAPIVAQHDIAQVSPEAPLSGSQGD